MTQRLIGNSGVPATLGLLAVAASILLLACSDSPSSPVGSQPDRPNLILIVTDDMAVTDTSFMPTLLELAADRGTTFSNAFVTTPQCGPSRASILRGQYVHNHGMLRNELPFGGFVVLRDLGLERSTVATWVKSAGYTTAYVGKYMNHYGDETHADWDYVPPGWDEWYALVPGLGKKLPFFDFQLNENGTLRQYSGPDRYATDVQNALAVDFVRRRARAGTSFFLMIGAFAPHEPATPAPRDVGTSGGAIAPRTPSFNEEDVSDKPVEMTFPLLETSYIAWMDGLYRRRVESLSSVDDMLDSLVAALQETRASENTYIFFTSDNGMHLGQHRLRHGKGRAYDEDLRVPLIVIRPGGSGGRVREEIVLSIDIAPTLADLAGAPIPGFVDGRSLASFLAGDVFASLIRPAWRKQFLAEHWNTQADDVPRLLWAALRTRDQTYIEWTSGGRELYDLNSDPFQLQNGYPSADSAALAELSARLEELKSCSRADCRVAEGF